MRAVSGRNTGPEARLDPNANSLEEMHDNP